MQNLGKSSDCRTDRGREDDPLVNLIMRFYEVDSGSIYLDGIKTTDMTRENLHDQFSMVLQDTWLFEGTVKENIVYNKQGVSDEAVKQALPGCWNGLFYREFT